MLRQIILVGSGLAVLVLFVNSVKKRFLFYGIDIKVSRVCIIYNGIPVTFG